MRALARMMFCLLVTSAGTAVAQSVPPPSSPPAPAPTAWACTKKTLLEDAPCTVEGRTAAQPASKEAGKEHQHQAKLLAEDVCRSLARASDADEDTGLLAVCNARMAIATRKCGGDGARQLLDDDGRFNPGHTKCYGALAGVVRDMVALSETSSTCCACLEDRCSASAGKCVEKIGAGQKPDANARCLTSTCSSECAVLQLTTTRKP